MEEYGIAAFSVIPCRREPDERTEMVNQLLFGESYRVLQTRRKWLEIKTLHDDYTGFIDKNMHTALDENHLPKPAIVNPKRVASQIAQVHCAGHDREIPVSIGSVLPRLNGNEFYIGADRYTLNGEINKPNTDRLTFYAQRWLGAPYLWGGRSIFGIDCSGFMQVAFALCGIQLPRDASQQALTGTAVTFDETASGDLAFFQNESGKVVHVGLLIGNGQIIHASGHVHIDHFTHHGIESADNQELTHILHSIRRSGKNAGR